MSLQVCELFTSIQGESRYAGFPFVFVRLVGCNLRCRYCDTTYARSGGRSRSVTELVAAVLAQGIARVCITGGEPLLQPETPALISALLAHGCLVTLETNGSLDISRIDPRCSRIVDVKCPSSGEQNSFYRDNCAALGPHDELKFVVADRADYQFARSFVAHCTDLPAAVTVSISPVADRLPPAKLAAWLLADRVGWRLNVQLHKYLWPDRARGV